MSTDKTWQIVSDSYEITEQLAAKLGANAQGGEIIELISDLGGGKTTFVRGLARGLGSIDHVSSPTFKISNVYRGKDLTLYHYDFYRLPEAGLLAHELHDALEDPKAVIVVEWGEIVRDVLPEKRLTIKMTHINENSRELTFQTPKELEYLLEGLC
jgi:tRNA threonylcarbamoyladenosine biosynthesis protein TsaE